MQRLNEPNLVFSDLDGTLFRGNATRLLLDKAYERKYLDRSNVAQGMFVATFSRPLPLDVRMQLGWNTLARLFKGKSYAAFQELAMECAEYIVNNLYQDVAERLVAHQAAGAKIILVSASPEDIVRRVANYLNFSDVEASQLEVSQDGAYLTGRRRSPLCYGAEKVRRAQLACNRLNAEAGESAAYTLKRAAYYADDRSDYPLLARVGQPVVVNPSSEFYEKVQEYDWQVMISA